MTKDRSTIAMVLTAIGIVLFGGAAASLLFEQIRIADICIGACALAFVAAHLVNPPKKPVQYKMLKGLPGVLEAMHNQGKKSGARILIESEQHLGNVFARLARPCHVEVLWHQRDIRTFVVKRIHPVAGILEIDRHTNECPGWLDERESAANGRAAQKFIEKFVKERKEACEAAWSPWRTTAWHAEYRSIEKVEWIYCKLEIQHLWPNDSTVFLTFHFFVKADDPDYTRR